MDEDTTYARTVALQNAVELYRFDKRMTRDEIRRLPGDVLRAAARFERWLIRGARPSHLVLTAGVVLDQDTHEPTGTVIQGEDMAQLHDNEQFTLTVEATDAKGQPVGDTLTWSIDDTAVATLQVSADTLSCTVVAGSVGSATITVTDGTLSATEALDVIAGPVAAISIVEGPVSVQGA